MLLHLYAATWHPKYFKVMLNTDIIFKQGYLMKIPIESSKKKSEYSINMYRALDLRVFPKKWWEFI